MRRLKASLFESALTADSIIDSRTGLGSVPDNLNVDYKGLRVQMKPSIFLKLASPLIVSSSQAQRRVDDLVELVRDGTKLAPPFLDIRIPEEWENIRTATTPKMRLQKFQAKVLSHEGRHRMLVLQKLLGDTPVEVHLFFVDGLRASHLQRHPEWVSQVQQQMLSQINEDLVVAVDEPLFVIKRGMAHE